MEINLFNILWGVGLFVILRQAWELNQPVKTEVVKPETLDDMGLLMSDVRIGEGFWPDGMRAMSL